MKKEIQLFDDEKIIDIKGFNYLYSITNYGRVISSPKHQNGYKNIEKKQIIDNRGYFRVCLGKEGKKYTYKVHRIVAEYFVDNPNNYKEVNHIDGNKLNNFYKNLEWTDRKNNMIHASKMGLLPNMKGEFNNFSILTADNVIDILKSTKPVKILANIYGVSSSCIYDIKSGRSWSHISNQLDLALENT